MRSKILIATIVIMLAVGLTRILMPEENSLVAETGRKDYVIDDGVYESLVFGVDDRNESVRMQVIKINHGSGITMKGTTAKYYTAGSTEKSRKEKFKKWGDNDWGYKTVRAQAEAYLKSEGDKGDVVAALNGDFYDKNNNGCVMGTLVLEGNVLHSGDEEPYFAVLDDGEYEIRDAANSASDVAESIGGGGWILRGGKDVSGEQEYHHPSLAIGLTKNRDVVIANIDTTNPGSRRSTLENLASVMKSQGCTDSIYLDSGGSATVMTKRQGDDSLKYRNTFTDGSPRNVSSAMLFVKKDKAEKGVSKDGVSTMVGKDTSLEENEAGKYFFRAHGKPVSGFKMINNRAYLFDEEGAGMDKTVEIGDSTYKFVNGRLDDCSDKNAGNIAIGYCGDAEDEENVMYAYHYGSKTLNIGPNPLVKGSGGMRTYEDQIDIPWYTEKYEIKEVHIGKGVTSVCDHFAYISRHPFNDLMKDKTSALEQLSLPEGLKTIGEYAFYNNKGLADVRIPESVTTIGKNAFGLTGVD